MIKPLVFFTLLAPLGALAQLADEAPPASMESGVPQDAPLSPFAAPDPDAEAAQPEPAAAYEPVQPISTLVEGSATGSDLYSPEEPAAEETASGVPTRQITQYWHDSAAHAAPPDLTLSTGSPFNWSLTPAPLGSGIHPFLSVGAVYDDNIFLEPDNEESDLILTATLGVQAEFGSAERGVSAGYALSGFLFTDHSENNSLNHDLWATAHRQFSKTRVAGAVRYQHLSGSDRDAGGYTERDSLTASLDFGHELSGKTNLHGGVHHTSTFYDAFNDSADTNARFGADYAVTGKTRLGAEGVVGYLAGQSGVDQTYEQANATLSYGATGKLTFTGSAGWEWRQGDGGGDSDGFVYSLGLFYQPRETTTVSLRGSRHTFASALFDDVTRRSTNVELGLSQKIYSRFALSVAAGYEHSEYQGSNRFGAGREDDYFYVRPSLSFGITSRVWSTFFYEYRHNDSSSVAGQSFENNRVGAQVGITF